MTNKTEETLQKIKLGILQGLIKGWKGLVWLWIPRLVAAIIATWLYSLFLSARRLYVKRADHKKLCDH